MDVPLHAYGESQKPELTRLDPALSRFPALASDLVWASTFGNEIDVVGGGLASKMGSAVLTDVGVDGKRGRILTAASTEGFWFPSSPNVRRITKDCTFLVRADFTASGGAYGPIWVVPFHEGWSAPYGALAFAKTGGDDQACIYFANNAGTLQASGGASGFFLYNQGVQTYVAVRRGNLVEFWRNGTLRATTSISDETIQWPQADRPVMVGNRHLNSPGEAQAGAYDLVAVWARALTADEVRLLSDPGSDPYAFLRPRDVPVLVGFGEAAAPQPVILPATSTAGGIGVKPELWDAQAHLCVEPSLWDGLSIAVPFWGGYDAPRNLLNQEPFLRSNASWVVGDNGPALAFSGTEGSYAHYLRAQDHHMVGTRTSVFVRFRPRAITGLDVLISNSQGGGLWIAIDETTKTLRAEVTIAGGKLSLVSTSGIVTVGTWHSALLVIDGLQCFLYLDGIQVAQGTMSAAYDDHEANWLVLAHESSGTGAGGFQANAEYDVVYWWNNAALNATQAKGLTEDPYKIFRPALLQIPSTLSEVTAPTAPTIIAPTEGASISYPFTVEWAASEIRWLRRTGRLVRGGTVVLSQGVEKLVFDGDSVTTDDYVGNVEANTYPYKLLNLLGRTNVPRTSYIYGVSGQTITQAHADAATQIYPLFAEGNRRNILSLMLGSNDLGVGAQPGSPVVNKTAEQAFNDLVAYAADAVATLPYLKVVVWTLLPRDDNYAESTAGAFNLKRNEFNERIRNAVSPPWHAYVDPGADPRIGDDGDNHDTTYYTGDKIHLNSTGNSVLAELGRPVFRSLL